jgi:hypothetical protein
MKGESAQKVNRTPSQQRNLRCSPPGGIPGPQAGG